MDAILVVNAGSSSLKFQIFEVIDGKPDGRVRGNLDGIGVRPRLRATSKDGVLVDRDYQPSEVADLPAAVGKTREWLASLDGIKLLAIGHRVVHGGPNYDRPILIDAAALDRSPNTRNWRRYISRTISRRSG